MTVDTPNPDAGKNWKQAASKPPPSGMVARVIAISVAIAFGLLGWVLWSTFGTLSQTTGNVEEFAAGAVATIAAHWDAEDVSALATPALASALRSGTPLAERYRILGNLMSVGKCSTYRLNITNGVGDAEVRCAAEFVSAEVTVVLGMGQSGGYWKIYDIAVML